MNIKILTRYFIGFGVTSTVMYLAYLGLNLSVFGLFFLAWQMSPYIVWAFINEFRPDSFSKRPNVYVFFAMAMPAIGFGMVFYTTLFPDAQNAFFILYIPFVQFVCLALAWVICEE